MSETAPRRIWTVGDLDAAEIERLATENARLREAATKLRDDMLERARCKMDVIHGEEYRIVNAGRGVWDEFCAALEGALPEPPAE